MPKKIDRIIKENFEEIFVPVASNLLNLKFDESVEIADDLHITIESQPDFLKKLKSYADNKEFILHIEFQSTNNHEMAKRMLLYYSMLYKKYGLPIYQQVFYLGGKRSQFKTALEHEFLNFRYNLLDFKTISYNNFLNSEKPEEIILAILGDFENRESTEVAEQILKKITDLKIRNESKLKSVKQLEVLSSLRNLQGIVELLIPKIMPIEYDIRKDLRYKQGLEQGLEKGLEQGLEKGLEQGLEKVDKMIIKLLKKGDMSIKEIAEFADVSQRHVKKLLDTLDTINNKLNQEK